MDVEVKKQAKKAQLSNDEVKELIKKSQDGDQQA
ncbi:RNA polymerase sigma-F factor, partial [Bacillus sp. JR_15]